MLTLSRLFYFFSNFFYDINNLNTNLNSFKVLPGETPTPKMLQHFCVTTFSLFAKHGANNLILPSDIYNSTILPLRLPLFRTTITYIYAIKIQGAISFQEYLFRIHNERPIGVLNLLTFLFLMRSPAAQSIS